MGDKTIHCHFCEDDGNIVLDKRLDLETFASGEVYKFTIWPNFECDGASIPRLFWRFMGHPLQYPMIVWAVVHDWLYKSHATSKWEADAILREGMMDEGIGIIKSWLVWFALMLFGWLAWWSHNEDDQEMAKDEGMVAINGVEV